MMYDVCTKRDITLSEILPERYDFLLGCFAQKFLDLFMRDFYGLLIVLL